MKTLKFLLAITILSMFMVSCWDENIPEAGAARHQVTSLTAVPGDEEVDLSWDMPDGWYPTDFIVFFTNADSEVETYYTGGAMNFHVSGLVNGTKYTFSVQAVYDTLISGAVEVSATPSTTRFPVSDLEVVAGDGFVTLSWTKPGAGVLYYTLSYYNETNVDNVTTLTLDADLETYTLEGLDNDLNYYFALVAVYSKGESDATSVRAMPTAMISYFLSRDKAAVLQPITFTFNREGYPDATDVTWTFPGNTTKTGDVVEYGFPSSGTQVTTLSATVDGTAKNWSVEVEIRDYVIYTNDLEQNGSTYNGFKGSYPVFSPDGQTIYNITFNAITALYAYDLISGEEKWRFVPDVNADSYNPLTVNPITGDIYYGTTTSGQFYAVDSDGNLKWQFTEAGSMKSCAPAVNKDGSVVFICDATGNTFAINASTGSKIWSFAAGTAGSGLLVNGDELVVGATSSIYFLNVNTGDQIAKVSLTHNMTDISGFAVTADKTTAYVPQVSGYIASVNLSTHEMIVDGLLIGGNNNYEPVVAPNGTVFVGNKDSAVYNVDADLTKVNWSYAHLTETNNAFNYSHPCVDSNNRFYITSGQNINSTYIFDANGNVVDTWTIGDSSNQKQMGGNNFLDGVIYSAMIGGTDGNGIFYGKYVGGERADGPWSGPGGDICGSCCIK